jgi:hypothetical protein
MIARQFIRRHGTIIISSLVLLAVAWCFSGYVPDSTIPLSGNWPLAVMKDGTTLIVGSPGGGEYLFTPHVIGPIRFLDLATGKETRPPVELNEINESWVRPDLLKLFPKSDWFPKIAAVSLSDDERRLLVVRTSMLSIYKTYYITVIDVSTRAIVIHKAVNYYDVAQLDPPSAQLSHDGRLLAYREDDGNWDALPLKDRNASIVIWDLDKNQERFRVPGRVFRSGFQFSPDDRLLAASTSANPTSPDWKGTQLVLVNTADGKAVHVIRIDNSNAPLAPIFSPDGKFVALENGGIRVFDVASGTQCFQAEGQSPQFLPGGLLLGVTDSHLPLKNGTFFIPAISIWRCGDWSEVRSLPYDLGASPLSGTVMPRCTPIGRGNEFAVTYETVGGWWTESSMASKLPGSKLLRKLGFNAPGELGVDVVDATTGKKHTYFLDCDSGRKYTFPQAGKVVIPQTGDANSRTPAIRSTGGKSVISPYSGDTAAVWSIPPRRTYRAVWITAGLLAAIAVVRRVARVVFHALRGKHASVTPQLANEQSGESLGG